MLSGRTVKVVSQYRKTNLHKIAIRDCFVTSRGGNYQKQEFSRLLYIGVLQTVQKKGKNENEGERRETKRGKKCARSKTISLPSSEFMFFVPVLCYVK